MDSIHKFIEHKLQERRDSGGFRTLRPDNDLIDFCSNDYLGFARSGKLKNLIDDELKNQPIHYNGSTGSRLLAGNSNYALELEQYIAGIYQCEAALLFNSGYDANIGLLSALPQRGDTVLHDELIHASAIDGIRLSNANRYSFRHNDLHHLEDKLKRAAGRCYVVAESIYSMDGDAAPLASMADLCLRYQAALIVDEAHATGLYGKGLVSRLGIEERVFARTVTFGKALGCHGAVVLGSRPLIDYLINFARSFIYTTAAPFHQLAAVRMGYQLLLRADELVKQLEENIHIFKNLITGRAKNKLIKSDSAIQCIILGSAQKARDVAETIQQAGFDVRAICSPTVAPGTERLRLCLHAFNTMQDVHLLCRIINETINE